MWDGKNINPFGLMREKVKGKLKRDLTVLYVTRIGLVYFH